MPANRERRALDTRANVNQANLTAPVVARAALSLILSPYLSPRISLAPSIYRRNQSERLIPPATTAQLLRECLRSLIISVDINCSSFSSPSYFLSFSLSRVSVTLDFLSFICSTCPGLKSRCLCERRQPPIVSAEIRVLCTAVISGGGYVPVTGRADDVTAEGLAKEFDILGRRY